LNRLLRTVPYSMPPSQATIERQLNQARARFAGNDTASSLAILRPLHRQVPDRRDVAMLLAEVLRSEAKLNHACQVLIDVCRANDFDPALALRCAAFAQQCDRHAVARQICDGALVNAPRHPDLRVLAGHLAREVGEFSIARGHYDAALDAGVNLDRHHVLAAIANMHRFTDPADPFIARMQRHVGDPRYSPRSRASAGFGLAKAADDLADYAAAAHALREANARVHAAWPWQPPPARELAAQASPTQAGAATAPGFVPVFIVGLPRTGTTLATMLLAQATGGRDRGELRALRFIAERLIAGGYLAQPAALTEAASLYRKLAVQDDAPATWYLDQDPLNFRYLDVALAMFPQARIVTMQRSRRDTALSLWSHDFAHPDMAFAYDFDAIARFADGHDVLMARFERRFPNRMHRLGYEDLVADPEATITALREALGAPAGAPSANEPAPVQSASVWQARQAVYRSSVGRADHYLRHEPQLERFER
jgi:hypothetical protein